METIKFGFKYFRKSMSLTIWAEICSLAGIFANLLLPLLLSLLVDFVIQDGTVTEKSGGIFHFLLSGKYGEVHSIPLFFSIAAAFLILLIFQIGTIYARDLLQEKVGLDVETTLRYKAYDKLMSLDSATITDYNSGELLQILNSDTGMFKELFSHILPYTIDSIFLIIVPVVMASNIHILFIIIPVLLAPFVIMAVLNFRKKARQNFKEIRNKSSEMNLMTQENIAAVRIVRSFTNEELEKQKFERANRNFWQAHVRQIWLSSKYGVAFQSINQTAYIGTIVLGTVLAINGSITVGNILAVSSYIMMIMNHITNLNNYMFNMQQMSIAGLELKKFIEKESQVPDSQQANLHCDTPNIELKDVSLTIEGQEVLKNINLSIPYGKKVGIVGETGSGKSVLLKTLVRTRDITSGSIVIDGHDIKDFRLENLRNMYSFVFQDVFLFSNTIESNIAFDQPNINERLVTQAASHAQAAPFIDALSERYKTIIGERGLGISGGQKQRLSIARAFHKNAPIFILDDSTSALDVNTERTLLQDIHDNFSEKTVIITAHRFSSVVNCDEIIYLKDGEITERGTFQELMDLNGSFAHVYNVQQAQRAGSIASKLSQGKEE